MKNGDFPWVKLPEASKNLEESKYMVGLLIASLAYDDYSSWERSVGKLKPVVG